MSVTITKKILDSDTIQRQRELLLAWSRKWQEEQIGLINQLYVAEQADNHAEITHLTGQLRGLTEKKFPNLDRFFYNLPNIPEDENSENAAEPHMILLTEYATAHHVAISTCHKRIERGTLKTAILRGRDWWIRADEPMLDHRKYTPRLPNTIKPDVSKEAEEIKKIYESTGSIKETAAEAEISECKVVKLLSTIGVWVNEDAQKVSQLIAEGYNKAEIAEILKKKISAIEKYVPYMKGTYKR